MYTRKPFNGNYQETSPFGQRIHPVTKEPSFHKGIDFATPIGTPLVACVDGSIKSGEDEINGKYAQLFFTTEQGTKGYFLYAHLSEVSDQKKVKAGDEVGKSGASGRVTGPCFHFQLGLMLAKKGEYQIVNPYQYVDLA